MVSFTAPTFRTCSWELSNKQPLISWRIKIGAAIVLSLTALSGELAKYLHGVYLKMEPHLRRVQKRLGLLRAEGTDSNKANDAHAKRALLLGLARYARPSVRPSVGFILN